MDTYDNNSKELEKRRNGISAPAFELSSYIGRAQEPVHIQALIVKIAVERFDVAVLHRAAGLDIAQPLDGYRHSRVYPSVIVSTRNVRPCASVWPKTG